MMASVRLARTSRRTLAPNLRSTALLAARPWASHTTIARARADLSTTAKLDPARAERVRRKLQEEVAQPEVNQTIRVVPEAEAEQILSQPGMEQGVLYLDSAFSIALGNWDPRRGMAAVEVPALVDKVKSGLPTTQDIEHDFHLLGVRARQRDGGAFLYFAYRTDTSGSDALLELQRTLEGRFARNTASATTYSWLLGHVPRVHVVRGKPWIEDLDQWPSNRLKLKVTGGSAGEQDVWEALRPYGRIKKIEPITAGAEYRIVFSHLRSAAAAKNCAHLMHLSAPDDAAGPTIQLSYEQRSRPAEFFRLAGAHPKVMVPLLLTILGLVSVGLVDPMRAWVVEQHVKDVFDPDSYKLWQWVKQTGERLRQEGGALLGKRSDVDDASANAELWRDRRAGARALSRLLHQTPTTFITVTGPRGSGKSELLKGALEDVQFVLDIDAAAIAQAGRKGDAAQLSALAQQTGYWPSFTWLNSVAGIVDLAAAGLIGSKPGFATPPDQQLKQILSVVTQALGLINRSEAKAATQRDRKATQERARAQAALPKQPPQVQSVQVPSTPTEDGPQEKKVLASTSSYTSTIGSVVEGAWNNVVSLFAQPNSPSPSPTAVSSEKPSTSEDDKATSKAVETGGAALSDSKESSAVDLGVLEHAAAEDPSLAPTAEARRYPAVVIRNFRLSGVKNKDDVLYAALAEWGAELVQSGVANVVFVSDNSATMSKDLARALPNKPFEAISLADADPLRARKIVAAKIRELAEQDEQAAQSEGSASLQARLAALATATGSRAKSSDFDDDLDGPLAAGGGAAASPASANTTSNAAKAAKRLREQLDPNTKDDSFGGLHPSIAEWVDKLGGRQTDLENLVEKVSLGQTVQSAVQEMIARTVVALRKTTFGEDAEEAAQLPWSRPQAWAVVSQLAAKEQLPYYGALYNTFKGAEAQLKALEQAEVISIRHVDGRPAAILPGRPVFLEAMRALVADPVFADTQRYLANKAKISADEGVVSQVGAELKLLKEADMSSSSAGRQRASFLLASVAEAQTELETLYEENAKIQAQLNATVE